jgi:glutamate/tyrosine decarboxylase-like PLP-dependent enzyme
MKQIENEYNSIELILEKTKTQSIAFLNRLKDRPTFFSYDAIEHKPLNKSGIGTMQALLEFEDRFGKYMIANGGPKYWGFVIGGATPASIVGDWLTTAYDQIPFASKSQTGISTDIEIETINFLLELFGLPDTFYGGFVSGATMSNFTCLATARQWHGKQTGTDVAKDGIISVPKIFSATAHSSVIKSLSMLGIGSKNISQISTEQNRERILIAELESQLEKYRDEPVIVVSSAGTVNTGDFDDLQAIAQLKAKYNFWWHIDAAFGAFAACSKKNNHLLYGWQQADSITVDCHKWLNVPYDSAVFFVNKEHKQLQAETFQNSNAPYLGNPEGEHSYMNLLPENSRRLRALPAWFTLKAYGNEGYAAIVENSIETAKYLGRKIENSGFFELLSPVALNIVCFTLKKGNAQEEVTEFLNKLISAGKVFMSPTTLYGRKGIRAALVNWHTKLSDIDEAFKLMEEIAAIQTINHN